MRDLLAIDWAEFFVPKLSVLEVVLRGSLMYLAIFIILRVLGRRQSGSLGPADILVIVLLSDAAQNGMANDYKSVTEGIILVLTIVGWDFIIDWLAFHVPALRTMLRPAPITLIKGGVLHRRNMQREMITKEELMSQLREEGVESIKSVKLALLEGDGKLSVIKAKGEES